MWRSATQRSQVQPQARVGQSRATPAPAHSKPPAQTHTPPSKPGLFARRGRQDRRPRRDAVQVHGRAGQGDVFRAQVAVGRVLAAVEEGVWKVPAEVRGLLDALHLLLRQAQGERLDVALQVLFVAAALVESVARLVAHLVRGKGEEGRERTSFLET